MSVPVRRSIRLPDFDYATPGAYFVTICAHERACLFGDVVGGVVRLNDYGEMVRQTWDALPHHFANVKLDQFVIMPNHVHGIVVLTDHHGVGATHASPVIVASEHGRATHARATHASPLQRGPKTQSIGAIVGSFKSAATKRINTLRATPGHPVWQRNYYERVIRDDGDLAALRDYVAGNPARWADDDNHSQRAVAQGRNR